MLEVRAKECTYKGKTLLAEKETSEKQEKLCERLLFPPFLSPLLPSFLLCPLGHDRRGVRERGLITCRDCMVGFLLTHAGWLGWLDIRSGSGTITFTLHLEGGGGGSEKKFPLPSSPRLFHCVGEQCPSVSPPPRKYPPPLWPSSSSTQLPTGERENGEAFCFLRASEYILEAFHNIVLRSSLSVNLYFFWEIVESRPFFLRIAASGMSARPYPLPFLFFSLLALANYLFRREGKRRGRGGISGAQKRGRGAATVLWERGGGGG